MAKLFEPFIIRRIYGSKSGQFVHIGKLAGAPLVMVEATAVEPRGKIKGESL
jgi:hypothetical protein